MNSTEIVPLLRLVTTYSPQMTMTEGLPAVWWHALSDIPVDVATDAVHGHYRREARIITVADIRAHAARVAGLLPPDADTAYREALRWAHAWQDTGSGPVPAVHPTVDDAARRIGSHDLLAAPSGIVRREFMDAYRPAAAAAERDLLSMDMRDALQAAQPKDALTA